MKEIKLRHIIGQRIKLKRKEKGWTQEQLAEKADMHSTYIGKLERGDKAATIDSLEKVVTALDVPYDELFQYIQPTDQKAESSVLWQIINLLNSKSLDDQKKALSLLEFIFDWKRNK